ncbi:hypothetical protein B0A54_17762 [Friedmanniomyces endolithicus]|uniref:VOC domain-containing protein n=1 Tax=Friedmanniomyces endolithicus TaxID=329885 RepID=A0A4U0TSN3_9PEZI|nr:hypothetical protein LTS09_017763 [Friedmanniomyces endolithicus]TKA25127.1 hypothetical protein B0A54_17762 [Friedmanniomyces endolithicus]
MAEPHPQPTPNGSTTTPQDGHSEQWATDRPVTLDATGALESPHGTAHPNVGKSIPDLEAIGPINLPLTTWQKQESIDPNKQVKLVKLSHMRYQHPDLDQITTFLLDFGMQVAQRSSDGNRIWYRGYGTTPYVYYAQKGPKKFLGGTFQVESHAELEKALRLPGAGKSSIEPLHEAPGGGSILTLHDPEGFPVNLMHGQEPTAKGEYPNKILLNDEVSKPRVRKFNRFTPGPAAVHKLGHYGLSVRDFPAQVKWYTHSFNLAPTDFLYVPAPPDTNPESIQDEEKPEGLQKDASRMDVAVFLHVDRGDDPVDHHTFFMSMNKASHVHHCSFEVHDYDTQHLGHQWLASKNYTSVWGIGRHILGSQIFDYWWDTTGNMIEHYADGDLVNKDTPVAWNNAGDESLAVWGPEVPKWFLE